MSSIPEQTQNFSEPQGRKPTVVGSNSQGSASDWEANSSSRNLSRESSPASNAQRSADQATQPATDLDSDVTDSNLDQGLTAEVTRQQPIPPPSEPMQYRAIGLIRGRYLPSQDQFNRGCLVTEDNTQLDAVLLGQVMSLVKKHLDLQQEHLWVVYPRTREKQRSLHVQILGVWEPEELHKDELSQSDQSSTATSVPLQNPLSDDYFSIRGEVIFQSQDKEFVIVKIQQSPRKGSDKAKSFKLRLEGTLPLKAAGYFWNLDVRRQENSLVLQNGESIALIPPKKTKKVKTDRPQINKSQRPIRGGRLPEIKTGSPNPQGQRREPINKPIKRKSV